MNKEFDFLEAINDKELKHFLNHTDSSFNVNTTIEKSVRDYSWVPVVEVALIYLENIIKNPRQFIVQEEDILRVEKTKRVSEETVKHLAQHTNFIEKIDDDGSVVPNKLLNINKEDTFDIYENRFIYTLITRLINFINTQLEYDVLEDKYKETKTINLKAATQLKNEDVSVDLAFVKTSKSKKDNKTDDYNEVSDRIDAIANTLNQFMNTQFMKSISQASPVRSPIRRTNLILKEQNFKKALELWEYLDNYEMVEPTKMEKSSSSYVDDIVRLRYLITYYLNYISIDYEDKKMLDSDYKLQQIKRLIGEYALETNMTSTAFEKNIKAIFTNVRKEQKKKEMAIKKLYDNFFESYNKDIMKVINILK